MLATKVNDMVTTTEGEQRQGDELIAELPAHAWRRLSAGAGAHGPRDYYWTRIPIRTDWRPGRGYWLLARRKISDPTKIAYYRCYGPRRTRLHHLAWIAGSRWRIEECFQQAKNEAGLDHYQVRSWRAWYAHITLAMLAHAWLAITQAVATKGAGVSEPDMINLTLPEIRRLLTRLVLRIIDTAEHVWAWSRWRRRRRHQAKLSHYKRRGHALT